MNVTSAPTHNLPNTIVAHNPAAIKPVGLESESLKLSTFKAVEEPASSSKLQSRPEHVGDEVPSEEAEAARESAQKDDVEQRQLEIDQRQIQQLAARDREVRAHEQAHAATGGQYAGAASYEYQRGPDGRSYAVGGEVPIDVGREANPQDTLVKAQVVRRAALAPAGPSPQDRRVAAMATQMETSARAEIREMAVEHAELKAEAIEEASAAEDETVAATQSTAANDGDKPESTTSDEENSDSADESLSNLEKTNTTFGQISSSQANSSKGSILDQLA